MQVIFNVVSLRVTQVDAVLSNIGGLLLFLCISVVLFYSHIRYYLNVWGVAIDFPTDTPILKVKCVSN